MSGADSTTVEAAFISANAASYIASTYTATIKGSKPLALTLDPACLRTLNAFLDYFLAIIIKDARSTDLHDLKGTLARVLDSALGFVALNEAQAELETYRNQESASNGKFDWPRSSTISTNKTADFDVEAVWLQARIRCMIYSTVGEKEESDFPTLDALENSVTPPVAIFLTAILEFLGEHILLTSARFARERLGSAKKGVLVEDDLDNGVRLDKVLATIWQSYLTILPSHAGLRKKASRETITSTPDRTFTTLPFSQTAPPPTYGRNTDLAEQSNPRHVHPLATDFHDIDYNQPAALPELESLQAIPETLNESDSKAKSIGTPVRKISMDVSPLVPTKSGGNNTTGDLAPPQPVKRSASNASSLYVSGQATPEIAAPLAPTAGLWSRKGEDANITAEQKTLWRRPSSDSRHISEKKLPNAKNASPKNAESAEGFESGVYRYNVQRGSSTALNGVQQQEKTAPKVPESANASTNGSKSPFRAVYESVYAEQMALENGDAPEIPPKDLGRRSSLGEDVSIPSVQKTATIQTRQPVQIRQVVPKAAPVPAKKNDSVQGLGLRDVPTSNIEPGSDYEAFIQSEMARSREQVDNLALSEAERRAQRARILANRAAVIASQNASSRQASPVLSKSPPLPAAKQSPPVSTPPAGLYSPGSPIKKRMSRSTPRSASTSAEPSQTLLLAEFLRNTGPQRSTPRAVPLMSIASPKSTDGRDPFSIPSPQIKPIKATRADVRAPIDSSGTEDPLGDDSDAESWDEELYGPRPGASKGESMTDFLRNVPPPPESLRKPVPTAAPQSPRKISGKFLGSSPRTPRTPKPQYDDDEDTLIAGPAYKSPTQAAPAAFVTEPSKIDAPPRLEMTPVPTKTTLGRPIEQSTSNGNLAKTTSARSSGNFQPRGATASANAAEEPEESVDSDDDSIYGSLRRKPAKKESLVDFLKHSTPPGYQAEPQESTNTLTKMGRRISSLSILVGGSGKKSENSPTTASPNRPNHRPLVP